jgi:putative heme-binding domain-containing protein
VQNCAVCHIVRDVGQEVGPPLLGMAGSSAEALLVHILDPNRQVEPKYVGYNATLAGGEVVFGVITSETGNSITLKGLDGKARPIPRSDLKALSSTNRSLMPDGFESGLSKQDLADVIRFLQAPDEAP